MDYIRKSLIYSLRKAFLEKAVVELVYKLDEKSYRKCLKSESIAGQVTVARDYPVPAIGKFYLNKSYVKMPVSPDATHRRSKRYGRSGFGRTTFWPMTTPTITSALCACSEFINLGHRVTSEPCCCFVGEMDCVIPSQPHQPPASFTFPKRSFGKKTPVLRSFQHA